jgi:hypothetical protein
MCPTCTCNLRKKFFSTGEIKSSSVGKNHYRRTKILKELIKLPFQVFAVVIDKKACLENMSMKGLNYKPSFYKFMNNIVHQELRRAFEKITIVADEIGSSEYMKSFCKYVDSKQDIPNIWGDTNFTFEDSKSDARIQIADFISGTLSFIYDSKRKNATNPDYYNILQEKIIRIEEYPKIYRNYILEESALADEYDVQVAKLCFAQVVKYIEDNNNSEDEDVQCQIIVLQYLLFRFMNNTTRDYIYTGELTDQLKKSGKSGFTERNFRTRIIGKLRDKGVIIASSNKGYKIPSKEKELYDYVNHDATVVIPMLARLKKCRDLVKLATNNELDLLNREEYKPLKDFFDKNPHF